MRLWSTRWQYKHFYLHTSLHRLYPLDTATAGNTHYCEHEDNPHGRTTPFNTKSYSSNDPDLSHYNSTARGHLPDMTDHYKWLLHATVTFNEIQCHCKWYQGSWKFSILWHSTALPKDFYGIFSPQSKNFMAQTHMHTQTLLKHQISSILVLLFISKQKI